MEVIQVAERDTLGKIASRRGCKTAEEKQKFISSVMELNGIKNERLLQIGDLIVPDNSVFDKATEALADLEKSAKDSGKTAEEAPKPTSGQKFANWQGKVTKKAADIYQSNLDSFDESRANDKDAKDARYNAKYKEIRVANAKAGVKEFVSSAKGFTFTGAAFETAMANGDTETAQKLYVQGLTGLSKSYIREVDPEGNGGIRKSAFMKHGKAQMDKAGIAFNDGDYERMFTRSDLDGNGIISLDEQRNVFALMDYNSETRYDGTISLQDYANVRTKLTDELNFGTVRGELRIATKFMQAKPKAKEEPKSQDAPLV